MKLVVDEIVPVLVLSQQSEEVEIQVKYRQADSAWQSAYRSRKIYIPVI